MSDLSEILQSRYYEPLLGYDNVDWFLDEVLKPGKQNGFVL